MANAETGVLNPIFPKAEDIDSNFNLFVRAFDSKRPVWGDPAYYDHGYDLRRRDASIVAELPPGHPLPPSIGGYLSRLSLAAHWADDEQSSKARARELYTLATTVGNYAGQTVVRFKNCEYEDLEPSLDEPKDFILEFARIISNPPKQPGETEGKTVSVTHALNTLHPSKRPPEFSDVPLARFAVGIPVAIERKAIRRHTGELSVTALPVPSYAAGLGMEYVTARSGLVSLHPSEGLYRKTKDEKAETLLFGDQEANALVEDLASHDPDTFQRYQDAAGDDGRLFNIAKPFPDLSFFNQPKQIESFGSSPEPTDYEDVLKRNEELMREIRAK